MKYAIWLLLPLIGLPGCTTEGPPPPSTPVEERPQASASPLELRFLDVGQGDAVLLRSGGRTVLIDAGPSDRIVAKLRALEVDSIDLMIASHNHSDHIGGMDAVLDSIPVRSYLDNGHPATTRIQERVLQRVESRGITYLQATPRTITLGDTRLRITPAPEDVEGDDQNNRSVSVLVEHGEFEALLTGDSETELLNAWLTRSPPPDVDVLKAAHHGSRNGVTPAWLSQTRPEVVVVSVAAENSYGHPHEAAMRYFCTGGRTVLRTDRSGDVIVEVDGSGRYRLRSENAGAAAAC